ncbi:MAG: hypothetical protein LJF04_03310, partial [Gemmatimonadetes bacterium]|nr:hypothetical protein [Gemmatimonadota bacterium]
AFCWGGDHVGQLGTDSDWGIETCSGYRCSRYPQAVSGGHTFRDLDAGAGHVCGITTEGTAYCWGKNDKGQMGAGFWSEPMDRHATPLPVVGGHIFASISGGDASTCALAPDGRAFCWGSNDFGALGNGDPLGGIYAEPGPVSGAQAFLTLAAHGAHACALTAQGELYCWGWNKYGQLGRDPSSLEGEMSLVPVLVPLG